MELLANPSPKTFPKRELHLAVTVLSFTDCNVQPAPQGSNINELRALARKHSTYFRYGTSSPSGTALAQLSETLQGVWQWFASQLNIGADVAKQQAGEAKEKVKEEL